MLVQSLETLLHVHAGVQSAVSSVAEECIHCIASLVQSLEALLQVRVLSPASSVARGAVTCMSRICSLSVALT